jgi:hypothetical protein
VGVPAARGHGGDGGADIRGGLRGPEHIVSVRSGGGGVDRPLGSFGASTKGLQNHFAAFSLEIRDWGEAKSNSAIQRNRAADDSGSD